MQFKKGVSRGFIGIMPLQTPSERARGFFDPVAVLREALSVFARAILRVAEDLPNDSFGVGKTGSPLEWKFFFRRVNDVQQVPCGVARSERTHPLVQVVGSIEKIACQNQARCSRFRRCAIERIFRLALERFDLFTSAPQQPGKCQQQDGGAFMLVGKFASGVIGHRVCVAPPKTESQGCFLFAFANVKVFVSCGRSPVDVAAKVAFLESSELPETFTGSRAFVPVDPGVDACACERRGCAQRRQTQGEFLGFDFEACARVCRCSCRYGDYLVEDWSHDCLGCVGLVDALKNEVLNTSSCGNGLKAQGHPVSENGDGKCMDVFCGGCEAPLQQGSRS